ncbi:hypothetical protein LTR56_005094 [Elasticomyces elasticus]|nr:hypothetical protein LTR22_021985 [Elasticomyces elasticus]KAK3652384.1 hypothetical protein LTR56_005094 [Elasticomyces elasticus]KAK4921252.1 hypothetical protein LTR49_011255 [Elasticomyces elasticus]
MDLEHLDTLYTDLGTASKAFQEIYRSQNNPPVNDGGDSYRLSAFGGDLLEEGSELVEARNSLCGILTRLHTILAGPSAFLQSLTTQTHLLACVKWLGESQVISCVPLSGSVAFEELATLASVPELMLSATAGFLREVQPGVVAHTDLSAAFSTQLSYLDATLFLSRHITPSALQLTSGCLTAETAPPGSVGNSSGSLIRTPSRATFDGRDSRILSRQWSAYKNSMVGVDDSASTLLQQIDWKSLGKGVVVYICATHSRSTSQALLQLSHPLAVINQTYDAASPDILESSEVDNRLLVQFRSPTELQPVRDAVMYVLQPGLSPSIGSGVASRELLTAELHSHLSVLQANPLAILIVAPTLLPEANSGQVDLEVQARLQDFAHILLNNESAWEVSELMKLVDEVVNMHGRLVVVDRLQSAGCATIALVVQYRLYA